MRVEATALRAPLEKATSAPWLFLSVIFIGVLVGSIICRLADGLDRRDGREGG